MISLSENSMEQGSLWYLTSYSKFCIWQNSSSWVMVQDALVLINCTILKSLISYQWVIRVLNWLSLVVAENDQIILKWSAIYSEDKIGSSFPCILVSIKRGSHEITVVYSSLTPLVCQSNIFLMSPWLFLFWFCHEVIYCMI